MAIATVSPGTWSEILNTLRADRPELVRPWFRTLEPIDMQHGVIRVRTTSSDHYQYLAHDCQSPLSAAAQAVTGRLVTIQFLPPEVPAPSQQPPAFEAETENLILNEDYTFDQFVTGPCNQLAHAACVAAAESPGHVYNPLFIHGDVGLGKTHLLQAVCHQIRSGLNDSRILYISCETFMNHFVEAIERGMVHPFRHRYRHVDALVIDDIHFLAARERSREEFFHTFNTLYHAQKQIILSADESPGAIPSLEDRLISRFNWGLVARIDPPGLETRMAIVGKKAKLRCAEVPEDVVHYIAATVDSNTRELEGSLTRVLALSQRYGGTVDLAVAKEALGTNGGIPSKQVSVSDILQAVTKRYNIRIGDLQGKRRSRSIAFPRQICMYLARELTPLSLGEIGGYFGGRDHTTVLHAIRTIRDQQEHDSELSFALRQMTDLLRRHS